MSQELDVIKTQKIALEFAESGYFPDARTAQQAFVKVMAGREMGLEPFQSMTGIHIIQGKPVVGAGLLAAMLDRNPDYHYETEWEPDQANARACTVIIFKGGTERGRSRFSLEDQKRAGLTQANWSKFPGNMLFARAMSNAVRWYAPGLTGTSAYVEGELGGDASVPEVPERATVVATVVPYVDADDPLDDVPFVASTAAPAASDTAESPSPPGPVAADEPAAGSGGLITTLDDAKAFVRPMKGEQIGVLKRMLNITEPTTKPNLALALLSRRSGEYAQDILAEMSGWA